MRTRGFFELLGRRAMCRSYETRPVPRHLLLRVLEAARKAPSAGHSQGIRFAVISDQARRVKVAEIYGESDFVERGFEPWLSRAPVHVIAATSLEAYAERYAEPDKKSVPEQWTVPYPVLDGGKALMALYLAALECDLACGYLGPHAGPDLVKTFGLPTDWSFLGLVTLGYQARGEQRENHSHKRGWRPFDDVVKWL